MPNRSIKSMAALAQIIADIESRPVVIAIAGGVASGKTTLANMLVYELENLGLTAQACSTDNFLKTNAELHQMGLDNKKGWPESYNLKKLSDFIIEFKNRIRFDSSISIPYYCHYKYDVVPNNYLHVHCSDVLIVEGVTALNPQLSQLYDFSIYLEADPDFAKAWFVERALKLINAAIAQPDNFYHKWSAWDPEKIMPVLDDCWQKINLENLNQNIILTKDKADLVIEKNLEHDYISFIRTADA